MTLPASGSISMTQIANELGISRTGLNLGHAWVRQLSGAAPTGVVDYGGLYGQTGRFDASVAVAGGAIAAISTNAPFFGGTFTGASQNNVGNLTITFTGSPRRVGNIILKNNTSGASAVATKQDANTWVLNGADGNLLINREGFTDSFTLLPSN